MFQPLWFIAMVGLVVLGLRGRRGLVVRAAAVPLLAVCLLITKNLVLFGVPTTSSYLGQMLAHMTVAELTRHERAHLIGTGELSSVSREHAPSLLNEYGALGHPGPPTGIAVLDRRVKPRRYRGVSTPPGKQLDTQGLVPNLNNRAYVGISQHYLDDSLWVITHRPSIYAARVFRCAALFFVPSSEDAFLDRNRAHVASYASFVDRFLLGGVVPVVSLVPVGSPFGGRGGLEGLHLGVTILVGYAVALFYGLALAIRLVRERRTPTRSETVVLAMWMTAGYVMVVSCLTSPTENYRNRIVVDPVVVVILAIAARHLLRTLRPEAPDASGDATRI
jgi:hypothetical protein